MMTFMSTMLLLTTGHFPAAAHLAVHLAAVRDVAGAVGRVLRSRGVPDQRCAVGGREELGDILFDVRCGMSAPAHPLVAPSALAVTLALLAAS